MDNLEKIFDDIIKKRKEEMRLKDEYFADRNNRCLTIKFNLVWGLI